MPPLFSTITLITELLISAAVFYTIYRGYKNNDFPYGIIAAALIYEVVFNISYMAYRAVEHEVSTPAHEHTPFHIALAIFHGTFSLLMFIGLLVFMIVAWKRYKKGVNFFKTHPVLTAVFIACWSIAVLSGVVFYYLVYFADL